MVLSLLWSILYNLLLTLIITLLCYTCYRLYKVYNNNKNNKGVTHNHSLTKQTYRFGKDNWGFVICRHVNQKQVNEYWKESIRCIRRFHPLIGIVIIDDYSNPEMMDQEEERLILEKDPYVMIIQGEFQGAGELLPYYYFHKYRWFDYAMILHDSVFLNSSLSPQIDSMRNNNKNVAFLWSFSHRSFDDNATIDYYLHQLEGRDILLNERKLDKWKGCFGVMTCIRLSFVDKLVENHRMFEILLPFIKTRNDRMVLERLMSIIIHAHLEGQEVDTFFGDIHSFCRWGYNYDDYKNKQLDHLPIIKVWTGR